MPICFPSCSAVRPGLASSKRSLGAFQDFEQRAMHAGRIPAARANALTEECGVGDHCLEPCLCVGAVGFERRRDRLAVRVCAGGHRLPVRGCDQLRPLGVGHRCATGSGVAWGYLGGERGGSLVRHIRPRGESFELSGARMLAGDEPALAPPHFVTPTLARRLCEHIGDRQEHFLFGNAALAVLRLECGQARA